MSPPAGSCQSSDGPRRHPTRRRFNCSRRNDADRASCRSAPTDSRTRSPARGPDRPLKGDDQPQIGPPDGLVGRLLDLSRRLAMEHASETLNPRRTVRRDRGWESSPRTMPIVWTGRDTGICSRIFIRSWHRFCLVCRDGPADAGSRHQKGEHHGYRWRTLDTPAHHRPAHHPLLVA